MEQSESHVSGCVLDDCGCVTKESRVSLNATINRPALGPTQSPTQSISIGLPQALQRLQHEVTYLELMPTLRMCEASPTLPLI